MLPPGSAVAMLRAVFQDVHVQVKLHTVEMLLLFLDAIIDCSKYGCTAANSRQA